MSNLILAQIAGRDVYATPEQIDAMLALYDTRKGGMASVIGYTPTSGYVTSPTVDYTIITRFDYGRLIARKLAALDALSFADVQDAIASEPKLAALSEQEQRDLFDARREQERNSILKTQAGDRSDAHRQAHDTFYVRIAEGVVAHLVTTKQADGSTALVLHEGLPMVDAIMLEGILVKRTERVAGERKVVNSKAPTLMGNAIKRAINLPGTSMQRFTLRNNFERIAIDGETVTPDTIAA